MNFLRNKIIYLLFTMVISWIFISCEPSIKPPLKFESVVFDPTHTHFALNGSMPQPVDSNQAKLISDQIDFTFVYSETIGSCSPGLMDPITRSQLWPSRNNFYQPWLANAHQIKFYNFNAPSDDVGNLFNDALKDESKIAKYYDEGLFYWVPHAVYPYASCIGGIHDAGDPLEINIQSSLMYSDIRGFIIVSTGQRGIYKLTDYFIPPTTPCIGCNYSITVDIILEH